MGKKQVIDVIGDGQLPFDKKMQEAALGYLIIDAVFFLQSYGKIEPNWFKDVYLNKVYSHLVKLYERLERCIKSPEELKGEFVTYESGEINKLQQTIDRCIFMTQQYGLDYIKKDLNAWMLSIGFKKAVKGAEKIYNDRKLTEAYEYATSKLQDLNDTLFNENNRVSFLNTSHFWVEEDLKKNRACTLGFDMFDRLILPGEPGQGSLLPGETTMFLAPTNTGKTTALITIIWYNIIQKGKDILWITHEDSPDNLKKKMLICAMGVPETKLLAMYKNPNEIRRIMAVEQLLERHLVYIPYNKTENMYVERVVNLIKAENRTRTHHNKKGFDMVVDDYPARLDTMYGRNDPLRTRRGKIYNAFMQLSIEERVHCLLAGQGNRESSRASREGDRMVTYDDSSESFDVIMHVNNVITINRSKHLRAAGRTIFYVDKVRNAPGKMAINCKSQFDCFRAFMDKWNKDEDMPFIGTEDRILSLMPTESKGTLSPFAVEAKPSESPKPEAAIKTGNLKPNPNNNLDEIKAKRKAQTTAWNGKNVEKTTGSEGGE